MHRLTVALLAAVDAAIAVAVGIAAILAPLTLLWVFGLGGGADWNSLWPTAATIWQFGNLVPVVVTLPADYLAATGIDPAAASFVLSLSPLAFAAFTAIFAARSGVRASRAEAWATGVGTGVLVFGGLAAVAGFTAQNLVGDTELWQAILVPTLIFALPALAGALVAEWSEAGHGYVAALRDRVEAARRGWGQVPALVARGSAVVLVGLIGLGAAVAAAAVLLRGGQVVSLFQASNADGLGATVITLAQLMYLPTLVVWGMAFGAGPGVVVGDGGTVSPAGTQVGVLPGIPVLGALPESTTPWLLLLALVPVALGAFAGWIARSRLLGEGGGAPASSPLAVASPIAAGAGIEDDRGGEPVGARLTIAGGIAVVSAAGAALLAAVASGSLGPGTLSHLGPEPGPVALAVGLEVFVGAAILLMSPRSGGRTPSDQDDAGRSATAWSAGPAGTAAPESAMFPDLAPTLDLGPRRPESGAPVD